MDVLGTTHLAAAIAAMASGAVVLLSRKATRWHTRWGWAYVTSMLALNATALMIYDLFGGFGPFHVAAVASLATLAVGLVHARRRRPRGHWVEPHAYWMCGSYVGLLAAATSETATRYLDYPFGLTVAVASVVVAAIGVAWMLLRVPVAMRNMGTRAAGVLLILALLSGGCAGTSEDMSANSGDDPGEPSDAAGLSDIGELPGDPVGPDIIRGQVVFGHEVRSFRPCGEDTTLWLSDESGVLETVHGELTGGMEPYSEIFAVVTGVSGAAPAEGFGADYDGSLSVESVLYAGFEGPGCDADWASFRYRARGNEPFWMVEVGEAGLRLVRPGEADVQWAGAQVTETTGAGGDVVFRAAAKETAPSAELVLTAEPCRDSMSGAWFALSADFRFGEESFTGCTLVGRR